jgi:hypothetical protein
VQRICRWKYTACLTARRFIVRSPAYDGTHANKLSAPLRLSAKPLQLMCKKCRGGRFGTLE